MNDTVSYRYPWQIKRSKLPIDTTISERVINTEVSSEINSCQIEKNEEAVSIDEIVSPELYPSPSFSNGDLEELERSVIDTERVGCSLYYFGLQLSPIDLSIIISVCR